MSQDTVDPQYVARLAAGAQDPAVQALIRSWGPLEPEQLAVIARVFGGSVSRTPASRTEEAA